MSSFTTNSRGYTKILKVKICVFKSVLSSRSENTRPVIRDHVISSQMRKQLYNSNPPK